MEGRGYVARRKLASLRGELGADFSNVCNCEEETGSDYTCTCIYMYIQLSDLRAQYYDTVVHVHVFK